MGVGSIIESSPVKIPYTGPQLGSPGSSPINVVQSIMSPTHMEYKDVVESEIESDGGIKSHAVGRCPRRALSMTTIDVEGDEHRMIEIIPLSVTEARPLQLRVQKEDSQEAASLLKQLDSSKCLLAQTWQSIFESRACLQSTKMKRATMELDFQKPASEILAERKWLQVSVDLTQHIFPPFALVSESG